jgi:hypothetical protein
LKCKEKLSNMTKASKANKQSARQIRQATKTRHMLGRWTITGLVIVAGILVVVGVGAILTAQQPPDISGVQFYQNLSNTHTTASVTYTPIPPVGGEHNPVWLNCGIYDQPVPNENAVHSLEHGAIWITYQPALPQSAVDRLRQLVRGHSYVILSPYPNIPSPVIASAWGLQLLLTGADDPRLPGFIAKYERGPQTPEQGAPCSGGTGTPLQP